MLNIENVNFGYKKNVPILKNINLSIDSGFTLLVGENGSGKSTLINCITGQISGSGVKNKRCTLRQTRIRKSNIISASGV